MLVWKAELPIDTLDIRVIELPFENAEQAKANILKVALQYDEPVMWFKADDEGGIVKEKRPYIIQAIGTGHRYTDDNWRQVLRTDNYIGTALLCEGSLVLHYFITSEETYKKAFSHDSDYSLD